MPTNENSRPSYEELVERLNSVTGELEDVRASNAYLWSLYVETGRRLQVTSASIKAAISSLLSYDIFWDPVNQHEFYETISNSIDIVSKLVMLLTLAFRSEANSLELKEEPEILQEILASLQSDLSNRLPNFVTEFRLPDVGKLVLVDFEYLIFAMRYLFEFLNVSLIPSALQVEAFELNEEWVIDIVGVNEVIAAQILEMHRCKTSPIDVMPTSILPEHILGLHLACEILHMQGIGLEVILHPDKGSVLRLALPTENEQSVI